MRKREAGMERRGEGERGRKRGERESGRIS